MDKATETKTQKIVMKSDGLHIIGQSLRNQSENLNELRKLSKPISEWIEKNGNPNVSVLIGLEGTKVLIVEAGLPTSIKD